MKILIIEDETKTAVEQNGGRIELDFPASGGSCFRITLTMLLDHGKTAPVHS